ncbi:MAG: hypothetical protein K5777_01130 [Nitrosopumilus sp.]|nr:hypothetical protein [Nitrosopumilus sp.]
MKTVLYGSILAAVFAISIVGTAFAAGHLTIVSSSVDDEDRSATIEVSKNVNSGKPGAYGFGVFAENGVVALTTHAGADDSKKQGNDPSGAWHTHLVTLAESDICASGLNVDTATFEDVATQKIKNKTIELTNIDEAAGTLTGPTVAFTLSFESDESEPPVTHVCVNPTSINPPPEE